MDKDELKKIDEHVGRQCRLIRMSKKMSQEKVADSIGLTFQQVQKYELGKNRISASRLYQLSILFKISPILFFDGLFVPKEKDFLNLKREHIELIQCYDAVPKAVRRSFLNCLKSAVELTSD